MAEPLTKDKLYCGCGLGSCTDGNLITVKDLKSALEEFEKRISSRLDADSCLVIAKQELKKAFPTIYNHSDSLTTTINKKLANNGASGKEKG